MKSGASSGAQAGGPAVHITMPRHVAAADSQPRHRHFGGYERPRRRARLAGIGVQPEPMTPDQVAKFFAGDVAAMVKLGKDANITPMD